MQTLGDPRIPFYDQMYQVITEDIGKFKLPKPILVSWLTKDKRKEVEKELKNKPLPDITSIKNCFEKPDYKYPKANFTYFKWCPSLSRMQSEVHWKNPSGKQKISIKFKYKSKNYAPFGFSGPLKCSWKLQTHPLTVLLSKIIVNNSKIEK